ncbi:MAG TPA: hypothetical protein VGE39_08345 [Prosthecobacter sp.]
MSYSPSLSIAEQIKVLQSDADIATWSLKKLGLPDAWRDTNEPGNTERCQEAVDRLFTLTRADVEASLEVQGVPPEKAARFETEPGSRDGHYFIQKGKVWVAYYQERGYPNFSAEFDNLGEARKLLINHFIPVWLERLRVECRTKDGKKIETI